MSELAARLLRTYPLRPGHERVARYYAPGTDNQVAAEAGILSYLEGREAAWNPQGHQAWVDYRSPSRRARHTREFTAKAAHLMEHGLRTLMYHSNPPGLRRMGPSPHVQDADILEYERPDAVAHMTEAVGRAYHRHWNKIQRIGWLAAHYMPLDVVASEDISPSLYVAVSTFRPQALTTDQLAGRVPLSPRLGAYPDVPLPALARPKH